MDGILAWRDRMVASPRFRHWASRFWLTRPMARRRSREVFDLCAGFVYFQVLLTSVRTGLLEALAHPLRPSELAPRLGLSEEATLRLLYAAESLELVGRRSGGRYGLGPVGGPIAGSPEIRALIEHNALVYRDLADPIALLRDRTRDDTELGRYWAYARARQPSTVSSEAVADYSGLMAMSLPMVAEQVLDAYPLTRHRCLLDVGGGEGVFLELAGRRAPDLQLMLFDLPAVVARAGARLEAVGLGNRVTLRGGSFLADPLPRGADLITLLRVLPDHDDAPAQTLLNACRAALGPGGRLLIADPIADLPEAAAVGGAYFGFYTLAMGSGRARRWDEYRRMLAAAGFAKANQLRTALPIQTGLILASV